MSTILEYAGKVPRIGAGVFLAEGSRLIGDVEVGEHSSIWFNSVLRGDIERVVIGHHTNIQDNTVCHVAQTAPCLVGNYVTCGHNVVLHGCSVDDEVLIGMGAVLMNGVVVGRQSIVGASALLTEGLIVPPGSLVYGAPAKVISHLDDKERGGIRGLAEEYCELVAGYRAGDPT